MGPKSRLDYSELLRFEILTITNSHILENEFRFTTSRYGSAHCNYSTEKVDTQKHQKFKISLDYIRSSKLAWTT